MDKNTLTGFILIAIVLFGFQWYSQPSKEEMEEMARQDSIAQVEMQMAEKAAKEKQTLLDTNSNDADSTALFFNQIGGKGENITLSNNLMEITLNTRGGSIQSARLMEYNDQQKKPVEILRKDLSSLSYIIAGKNENIHTEDYTFDVVEKTADKVVLRLGEEDHGIYFTYTLPQDSYLLSISIMPRGIKNIIRPTTNNILVKWQDLCAQQEKGFDFEQRYSSLTYKKVNGGTDYLSETSEKTEEAEEPLQWVAFKNQFFSCVLIADEDFTDAVLHSTPQEKGSGNLKQYEASMSTAFDATGTKATTMSLYIGPNKYTTLQKYNVIAGNGKDLELEELVYLGWPLFRWFNRWLIMPLFDLLTSFGMNMGIVLLLLTIIVKVLVYPATRKSFISSAKMRVLKPEIDALSAKYPKPEDAMAKQSAMMQLYSQYGVSPMGGCLPMLIQMPIWIALFNFVPNAIELRGQSFLWADDLSSYDELLHWNTDLWLIGDHLSIFCLLFCATNIINTMISMRQQQNQMSSEQAQQMKMMQYMMYGMPIMFFFMFNNYSSGLCYYYFLSGLISILMMWYMRITTDDQKLKAKLDAYREQHKNDAKKPSSLAARLEALQKMQEQQKKS